MSESTSDTKTGVGGWRGGMGGNLSMKQRGIKEGIRGCVLIQAPIQEQTQQPTLPQSIRVMVWKRGGRRGGTRMS